MKAYWIKWRMWDKTLFDEYIKETSGQHPAAALRELRFWARRMKPGDIVFGKDRLSIIAVGIVQSFPKVYPGDGFSSFRDVQWLKTVEDTPVFTEQSVLKKGIIRFRGSALRLLQEIYGGNKTAT